MIDGSTKLQFRRSEKDFIRQSGKLSFHYYVLLGISLLKNSLTIELYNLLIVNNLLSISKSAYSQGWHKIQAKFYQASTVETSGGLVLKKWRGYFLRAIDGTCLAECRPVLPPTKELGNYFGKYKHGTKTKIVETTNAAMFAYLVQHNQPFVGRLKIGFNEVVKDFVAGNLTDSEVYFTIGKT